MLVTTTKRDANTISLLLVVQVMTLGSLQWTMGTQGMLALDTGKPKRYEWQYQ